MKTINLIIGVFIMVAIISCGPSAGTMAKKSCEIYDKFLQAESKHDSVAMIKYDEEFQKMDKELTDKYMYENPEWLLKYATLRDQCIKEANNKNTAVRK